jgi:hypothetical protein
MALRSWLKPRPLFAFNQVNRDQWEAEHAASLPVGASVLDMGASSYLLHARRVLCPTRFQHSLSRSLSF